MNDGMVFIDTLNPYAEPEVQLEWIRFTIGDKNYDLDLDLYAGNLVAHEDKLSFAVKLFGGFWDLYFKLNDPKPHFKHIEVVMTNGGFGTTVSHMGMFSELQISYVDNKAILTFDCEDCLASHVQSRHKKEYMYEVE